MALPICIEFFIRTFFHILKFAFSHTNLILFILILILISLALRNSIYLVLGLLGYSINLAGLLPGVSTLVVDWWTPFALAIVWGFVGLFANVFWPAKIILIPVLMVFGFTFDALTGIVGLTGIGELSNLIPLTPVIVKLTQYRSFNYILVLSAIFLNPLFLILATIFNMAGFSNICASLNGLLTKFGSIIILPASPKLLKTYFNLLKKWQKNLE